MVFFGIFIRRIDDRVVAFRRPREEFTDAEYLKGAFSGPVVEVVGQRCRAQHEPEPRPRPPYGRFRPPRIGREVHAGVGPTNRGG